VDYSLVWNYPYKKDYSNTEAKVTISGDGVNFTNKVFKYPYNVHFQAFEPGGTYNWSVTVDSISGGIWSFKVDDNIYPLNDRSVDITDNSSLVPLRLKIWRSQIIKCLSYVLIFHPQLLAVIRLN